jgi:cell division inhibitor SepF
VSILSKVKDFMGLTEIDDYEYDEPELNESYDRVESNTTNPAVEEQRTTTRQRVSGGTESIRNSKLNNVVGMPGLNHGVSEMVLIEPRSFEEMPQVIDALRQRKSVILNMTLIRQEEAQRSVDFVAGGTYAIDGHYERIGDNIFLFTPNCVQVSTNGSGNQEVTQQVVERISRPNRTTSPAPAWEPMHAAQ